MESPSYLMHIIPNELDVWKRSTGMLQFRKYRTSQYSNDWLTSSMQPIVKEDQIELVTPMMDPEESVMEPIVIPWKVTAEGSQELADLLNKTRFQVVKEDWATYTPTSVISLDGRKLREIRIFGPKKSTQASFLWSREDEDTKEESWSRRHLKEVIVTFHGPDPGTMGNSGPLWVTSRLRRVGADVDVVFCANVREELGLVDVKIPPESNPTGWEGLQLRPIKTEDISSDDHTTFGTYLASGLTKHQRK